MRVRRRLSSAVAVGALLVAACDGDGDGDDDAPGAIDLGDEPAEARPGERDELDAGATDQEPERAPDDQDDDTADPDRDDAADDADEGTDIGDPPADDDGAPGGIVDADDPTDVADLTVAEPGTWPVGDAGTVTFELRRRDLVLGGIDARPGWSVEVEEDDDDEIEIAFRRDRTRWRFAVERSGRHLEIEIRQRIDGAGTGGYDLGDAGTFAFAVSDGRLVLTSLEIAEGWSIRDRDEDDDSIEMELRADGRRVDVEVELDDGRHVELDIAYRIRSEFR